MKHNILSLSLPALLFASFVDAPASFGSPSDEDDGGIVLTSPYGPATPIRLFLGANGGKQYAVWQNKLTQDCTTVQIGDTYTWRPVLVLTTDVANATAPHFDDEVAVVGSGSIIAQCRDRPNLVLGRLETDDFSVTVRAGAGRDFLSSGDHPKAFLHGDAGDDRLVGRFLIGGEGRDVLLALSSATDEILDGGPGDDCIQDTNRENRGLLCGPGDDARTANNGESRESACERIVERCGL